MREIKFRAWHKTQKEMFTALYLTFSGRIGVWNNEETEIDFVSEYPYLILMQFTGLKDKNKKEIYEGDIIKYMAGVSVVSYANGCFSFRGNGVKCEPLFYYKIYEVIGNIYENPELLTEVK